MVKLTYLSLFVINQVRVRRLILGYSSRKLSEILGHSEGYIGMVESRASQTQYPPHEWTKLAEVLRCTVHDLLPEGQSDATGELVDKVVVSLSSELDVLLVLECMIASGFFAELRTVDEIKKHLFIEKAEQIDTLGKVLETLTSAGTLRSTKDGYLHR